MSEPMGEQVARNAEARFGHFCTFEEAAEACAELAMALTAKTLDLGRVMRERDEALVRAVDLEQVREELRALKLRHEGDLEDLQDLTSDRDELVDVLRRDRDVARVQLRDAVAHADALLAACARAELRRKKAELAANALHESARILEAELAEARAELLRSRSWQVARNDDAGPCAFCGQPILRGQALEPVPTLEGTKGQYRHVHCPELRPVTPPCPVDPDCTDDHSRRGPKSSPPSSGAGQGKEPLRDGS